MSRNVNYGEYEEDDEEGEYYDEEDDEDYDDADEINPGLTNLSADLRRLMGLEVEETETDWKPPERPGLDNSAPIIATAGNFKPVAQQRSASPPTIQATTITQQFQPQPPPMSSRPSATVTFTPTTPFRTQTQTIVSPQSQQPIPPSSLSNQRLIGLSTEVRDTLLTNLGGMSSQMSSPSREMYIQSQSQQPQLQRQYILDNRNDGEDAEDDDDEEEEEEDDEELIETRGTLESVPMSAELRRILGLPPLPAPTNAPQTRVALPKPVPTIVVSPAPSSGEVWKPPQTWGLANSEPIIKTSKNIGAAMMMTPSSPTPTVTFSPSTRGGSIGAVQYNEEEDNDDEEEDDEDYDDDADSRRASSLDGVPMSAELRKLFGLAPMEETKNTDWRPPQRSGLDNSDPIIKKLGLSPQQSISQLTSRSPSQLDMILQSAGSTPSLSAPQPSPITQSQQQYPSQPVTYGGYGSSVAFSQTNGNDDGEYNDDEDDDGDYDEEDEDDGVHSRGGIESVAMSPELRRLLGLSDEAPQLAPNQEAWKPPSYSGLGNSDPIIRIGKNAGYR